jgi:hypothetical protein
MNKDLRTSKMKLENFLINIYLKILIQVSFLTALLTKIKNNFLLIPQIQLISNKFLHRVKIKIIKQVKHLVIKIKIKKKNKKINFLFFQSRQEIQK